MIERFFSPESIAQRGLLFIPVILALTVHEWAHARVALALGDDTALRQGRLTLNPLAHIDPIGTVLLPLLGVPFGWAKPVPVDTLRFRSDVSMEQGLLLTAAAGPVSNLVMALLCAVALRSVDAFVGSTMNPAVVALLVNSARINVALALFNLLPIPPLDGSRVVDGLVPFGWRTMWERMSGVGAPILIVLLVGSQFLDHGPGGWIIDVTSKMTGR